ncbi:MAG: hypothetical protein QS721_07215 [Candidatus Endonucleobacter sp. (ex Gigantidas childressi)]|nr:hypothetical protein [Candidatus Endonucleobacter sp. (ex Gigantidas childressi)]
MEGSINTNSRPNSNNNNPLLPAQNSGGATSSEGVQLSYSTASSSEVVESNTNVPDTQNEQVALDQPATSSPASAQELSFVAGSAQLVGLQESVKFFNKRFDIDALDMADTTSVLMLVKGMVSDMRALSSLGSIDSASKELLGQLDRNLSTVRSIVTQQDELADKQELQTEKQSLKVEKETLLTEKESALVDKGGADEQLESEIELLKQEISVLTTDIASLGNDTAALTEAINKSISSLRNELTRGIQNIFLITNGIKQRFDKGVSSNGEQRRVDTDKVNYDNAVVDEKTNQMLLEGKHTILDLDRAQRNNQDTRAQKVVDEHRLEKSLRDFGANIPDGVLALLNFNDVGSSDTILNNLRKDIPDEQALVDIAKVFGAILVNLDKPSEIVNKPHLDQKSTEIPVTKDRGSSVEQSQFTSPSALAEQSFKKENNTDSQINKQGLLASSSIREIEAMKLESEAMSLVAKVEEERSKAENIISKNSPV